MAASPGTGDEPKRPLVLVADDDDLVRRVAEFGLQRAGYDVVTAPDGDQALQLTRARRPAVVVLDWMMPGRQGTEVCALLKGDPDTSALPVILTTGLSADDEIRRGFAAGADDYLTKPYEAEELVRLVARFARPGDGTP